MKHRKSRTLVCTFLWLCWGTRTSLGRLVWARVFLVFLSLILDMEKIWRRSTTLGPGNRSLTSGRVRGRVAWGDVATWYERSLIFTSNRNNLSQPEGLGWGSLYISIQIFSKATHLVTSVNLDVIEAVDMDANVDKAVENINRYDQAPRCHAWPIGDNWSGSANAAQRIHKFLI